MSIERRRWVLWGALAALVGVAAALVVVIRSDADPLRRLPLALGAAGAGDSAAGAAESSLLAAPINYAAADDLARLGGEAPAYEMRAAEDDDVAALAGALGLSAPPERRDGAIIVSDDDAQLSVTGSSWNLIRFDGRGVDSGIGANGQEERCRVRDDGTTECIAEGVEPDGALECPAEAGCVEPSPNRPADLPSQSEAEALVLDLLAEAGVDTAGAVASSFDAISRWSVDVQLRVDGTEVIGYSVSATVGPSGVIDDAGGVLGAVERISDYPLIDTRAAIDQLNASGGFFGSPPTAVAVPDIAVPDEPVVVPVPGTIDSGECSVQPDGSELCEAVGEAVPGEAPAPQPVLPDPEPVVPVPVPEPGPIEVTLEHAELIAVVAGSWDGSTRFVVPAYRMSGTDSNGNEVTDVIALALSDDVLAPPPGAVDPPPPDSEPEPAPTPPDGPVGESGYADILLHCGDIVDFDGRWWHTDDPVEDWNDGTEGGTLTLHPADPDTATFVGDIDGQKTAVFRAQGPAEDYPGCD